MAVLTILASVAWVVAVVGLYSAVRFSAQRRRGEVALRMAVGARQDEIIRGFVARSARPVGIGLVLGSAVFVLVFRWVPPEFLHVPGGSPVLIAVAVGLSFAASSSLAALLAAWQSSGVQPAEALRNE
jgi:ABC-type antimicrobial peptide transport system permease subunit